MVSIFLEGERERGKMLLWKEFVEILLARFGEQLFNDPLAELKKLRQVCSLQLYQEEFDLRLSRTSLNEEQAINHFLGGLKE